MSIVDESEYIIEDRLIETVAVVFDYPPAPLLLRNALPRVKHNIYIAICICR